MRTRKGACEWARDLARRQRPRQPLPADSTVVVWQSRAPGVAGGRYRLTSWIGTRGRTGANEYGRPSEASAACESRRGVAEGPSGTGASQRSRAVELRSRMAREPPRGPGSLSSTNRRAPDLCSASSGTRLMPGVGYLRRGEPKSRTAREPPRGPGSSSSQIAEHLVGVLGVVGQTGICPASGTLVEGNRKEPSGPGCPHRGPGPLSSGNRRVLKHVRAERLGSLSEVPGDRGTTHESAFV